MLEGLVLLVHPTWMHSLANVSFLLSCLIMSMVSENGVMARVAQKARLLIFFCLLPQPVQGSRNESQTRRQKLCHMIIHWRDWSHICVATWFKANWCKNNFAVASSTDASHKHWIREFILRVWQRIATKVLPHWAMAIYTCSFRQWRYRRVVGSSIPAAHDNRWTKRISWLPAKEPYYLSIAPLHLGHQGSGRSTNKGPLSWFGWRLLEHVGC
jgi:hypothetical protein